MYILIWILSFLILIILHEAWHFFFAKKFWVKVYEFWLWLPPKIKTLYKDKSWTEYTLNALPLWWFIRPKWEDFKSDSEIYDKDSFHSKPFWQKLIILLWWVIANLIIAFLLFFIAFWHWIKPIFIIPDSSTKFTAESYLFPTTSFAQKVWYIQKEQPKPLKVIWVIKTPITLSNQIPFKTWDIIEKINNYPVNTENIWQILKKQLWKEVKVEILRNNKIITYTWECKKDGCLLWIYFPGNRKIKEIKMNPVQAAFAALHEIKAETTLTFEWLKLLWEKLKTGHTKQALQTMSGPVGAVAVWKYILEIGIWEYIAFIWSISLALAIFNILPIPALDGWRILTTAIMHVFKLNPKKYLEIENYINILFFSLMLFLGAYIMYLDFMRFY